MKELYAVSFGLIALCVIFIIFQLGALPPVVPLFYSRPWGEEQLVLKFFLFIVPLASLIFAFTNMSIQKFIAKSNEKLLISHIFISHILAGLAFLAALLGIISVVRIAFVT